MSNRIIWSFARTEETAEEVFIIRCQALSLALE